jgi:hypothetical protein
MSFAQNTQSLSFSDPGLVPPGTTFNVSVTLSYSGYSAFGLSYWLEVPNALAPFLRVTGATYFTFADPNQPIPVGGSPFDGGPGLGASSGFMLERTDLGGSVPAPKYPMVPPGTYHITDLQFTLLSGAPNGMFAVQSTTHSPRVSEVADTDFNEDNIPAASFVLRIGAIPEPGTLSLLSVVIVGSGLIAYGRHISLAKNHLSQSEEGKYGSE